MKLAQRFDLRGLKLDEVQERAKELGRDALHTASTKLNSYRERFQDRIPASVMTKIEALKARINSH